LHLRLFELLDLIVSLVPHHLTPLSFIIVSTGGVLIVVHLVGFHLPHHVLTLVVHVGGIVRFFVLVSYLLFKKVVIVGF
jgi:hypothetical protein